MSTAAPRWVAVLRSTVGSTLVSVGLSLLITGAMSWLFHRELRADMLATGFVAGALVNLIVLRVVKQHRVRLREANQRLEERVAERTTELEEANRELRREMEVRASLQRKVMMMDRLATAGQLAAGISHEIRNPIASILSNAGFVREELAGDAPAMEALDDVEEAARRVHVLSTDLMKLSRPADDPVGPVELADVVASARRLAAHELRGVDVALDVGNHVVRGNPSRLCQVFLNLLINAGKAAKPAIPLHIGVTAHSDGALVHIEVRDDGCGIGADDLDRVWDAYFTTRAGCGGTGLGLPMVRAIVEALGGEVHIQSELEQGTVVQLALPVG